MTGTVPLSRAAPRAVLLNWWQEGKVARLDCTGFTCEAQETALPWVPEFEAVNEAEGRFRMVPPTPEQAAGLRVGRKYGLRVVLKNALDEGVEELDLIIEAT